MSRQSVRGGGFLGGEVVAALPPDWLGGAAQDGGHRKRVLDAQRDFIIERINAIPHVKRSSKLGLTHI